MDSIMWAAAALAITVTFAFAGLRAWRGWLDLRRYEIAQRREADGDILGEAPATRIEMADIKERLRKLEAIATGVDP